MRMRHYRLKDVPIRKRPGYIWTYYRWHILSAVFGLFLLIILAYMLFFHPRTDISVLWLSSEYDLLTDTIVRERLESLPWDVNQDGRVSIGLQYVEFSDDASPGLETQMELLTLMSAGQFHLFLVSESGADWLRSNSLLGTWADTGLGDSEDEFCVPCGDLDIFAGEWLAAMEGMFLTVAAPPEDEASLKEYRQQMEALGSLLEWQEEK